MEFVMDGARVDRSKKKKMLIMMDEKTERTNKKLGF